MRFHALSPFWTGGDDCHATSGSVTRASRFLIGLVTRFATDDGIPAGQADQDGEGEVIDRAIADKDRLGIEACLAAFLRRFPQPLGRSFPQVLVALHDLRVGVRMLRFGGGRCR